MTIHLGNVPAGSTLYIPFTTYDANGASVTMTGLAVTDIEIYKNGSTTQRASDNGYALLDTDGTDFDGITGLHGFSVDLSDNSDSGFFSVGAFYWVVVSTVTVSSQTVTLLPATFRIVQAENSAGVPVADTVRLSGTTQTARDIGASVLLSTGTGTGQLDFTSGVVKANVTQFGGSNGTFASGRPEVNTTHWAGTAAASTNTAGVPVVDTRQVIRQNTAQATGNSTTAIKLDASASATTNFYKYHRITVISGTGAPQSAICTAYDGTTKIATVSPAWPSSPDNTSVFQITVDSQADIDTIAGAAVSTSTAQLGVNVVNFGGSAGTFASGRPEVNMTHIAGSSVSTSSAQLGVNVVNAAGTAWGSGAITAASIASNAITSAKIATGAITAAKFAAGAIDAAAIATDAIGSAEFAQAAADKVWASATRILTANTNLNDLSAAGVRSAVGLASANLDTQLDALPTNAELATALGTADDAVLAAIAALNNLSAAQVNAEVDTAISDAALATAANLATVDTVVDAIKAKTDSLNFTIAGQVDANIQYVNDVQVTGTGAAGDEWGP